MDETQEYWYEVIYYVSLPVPDATDDEVLAAKADEPDSIRPLDGGRLMAATSKVIIRPIDLLVSLDLQEDHLLGITHTITPCALCKQEGHQ